MQSNEIQSHIYHSNAHGTKTAQMIKGWLGKCPNCNEGKIFEGFLKVNHACPKCGLELHKQRADDLPPYITISIVGHIIVPLILLVEKLWAPDLLLQGIVWSVLSVALTLWFLPKVKGAMIALQWAMGMHGFDAPNGASSHVFPENIATTAKDA